MNKINDGVRELIHSKSIPSTQLFFRSLNFFIPSQNRLKIALIIFSFFFVYFKLIAFDSFKAVIIITDISSMMFSLLVPLFAVIITGYALFQAMSNKLTLEVLLQVTNDKKSSKLVEFNNYFFGISICYLMLIALNTLIFFTFKFMPIDFHLSFFSHQFNEYTAAALISVYVVVLFFALIEMKSFIYNLFQTFLTSASAYGIDIIKEKQKKEKNERK